MSKERAKEVLQDIREHAYAHYWISDREIKEARRVLREPTVVYLKKEKLLELEEKIEEMEDFEGREISAREFLDALEAW